MWYPVKVLFAAWLVLPQFQGASFIYKKLVREQLRKYRARGGAAATVTAGEDHKVHIAKVITDYLCDSIIFACSLDV